MGNVVKFEAYGKEYHLSLMDKEGQKWVLAQQVGEALGNNNIRKLIYGLQETGEIIEGKHFSNFTLLNSGEGNPRRIYLSYRGIIRVSMRSQGSRAKEFRDWAEDVLYQVMMTGSYEIDRSLPDAISQAETAGMKKMLIIQSIAERLKIDMEVIGQIIKLRKMGMTQKQAGSVHELSKWQVQGLEKELKEAAIVIPAARKKAKKNRIDEIVEAFSSTVEMPLLAEGGDHAQ